MGGKSSGSIIGYKYYLGMHLAICKSADSLLNIIINNRVLYGSAQITRGTYDPTITGKFPDNGGADIYPTDCWLASEYGTMEGVVVERGQLIRPHVGNMNGAELRKLNSSTGVTDWSNPSFWRVHGRGACTFTEDLPIDMPNLFGGEFREGGISGTLGVKFGGDRFDPLVVPEDNVLRSADGFQAPDPYLVEQWGAEFTPAFRGIFSLIVKQMYIGVNPYLKNWECLVERTPCKGWYDAKSRILSTDGYFDTNPAHIVRELLVNHGNTTSWGLMYPTTVIDDVQFKQSADALYSEDFGLAFSWDKQETTEVFIQKIMNHISGVLRVNPLTGLFELKLIRHDHYLDGDIWKDSNGVALLHFDESNSVLNDYQSVSWGETVNEVTVRYSQRWTGRAQSITVQDIANMQIQGQIIAQTQDFLGITNGDLAARVAKMQLQIVSTPLNKIDITVNRDGFKLMQGDVFQFSWDKKGIVKGFYRVGDITRGKVGDGKITIKAVLDVFSLPVNTYIKPEQIGWRSPDVVAVEAYNFKFLEQTYWDVVYSRGGDIASLVDDGTAFLMGIAAKPLKDMSTFELYLDTSSTSANFDDGTRGHFCPFAKITGGATQEIQSTLTYTSDVDMDKVVVNAYGYLGEEIVKVLAINKGTKSITLARGMLDTVPTSHTTNVKLFLYGTINKGKYSSATYSALSKIDVIEDPDNPYYAKFLPTTSSDKIALSDVTAQAYYAVGRITRPYPVGNVKVNGERYPAQVLATGSLEISFSRRLSQQQTPKMELQSAGNIGIPEEEVYYSITIYYNNVLKRAEVFPYSATHPYTFTGLTLQNANTEYMFEYTMAMQDADLAGVGGYTSGAHLTQDTKIEIRAHKLLDDDITVIENYQTQTSIFRRDL